MGGNSADLIGAVITITDNTEEIISTATWDGSIVTTEIAMGTYYTVSVSNISGYLNCKSKSFLAGYQTERNVSFQYRGNGVFVEAIDGMLYTSSDWSGVGKTANSVVLITSSYKIKIALTETTLPIHIRDTDPMEQYNPSKDADTDFEGEGNTIKIIQFNTAYGTNTTSYAAPYCYHYKFTRTSEQCYLMSSGQFALLQQNKSSIDACLSACSGTPFDTENFYWTSTYSLIWGGNSREVVRGKWLAGLFGSESIATSYKIRPIANYE